MLMLLHASIVHAQPAPQWGDIDSPGLRIEAAAGWDGVADKSAPVAVAFLIHNDADRQIEGELRLTDTIAGHDVSLGEVVISAGTARRVSTIRSLNDWNECYATFFSNGEILWRRELLLNTGGFNPNGNYALFVDDGGRKLDLPGEVSEVASYSTSDFLPAGKDGRPVECLTVRTWQVPNHPAPMVAVQAIIFAEQATGADINDAQWAAIADWICQGGVVFLHQESAEILERLDAADALTLEPAVLQGEFLVRRSGLGAIHLYDKPLLPSDADSMRATVSKAVGMLPKQHITNILGGTNWHYWRGGKADRNRAVVGMFFGFYTLLIGILPLVLFRLSRRRMATYAVVVVGGTSILSGILGGFLRHSRGDLRWVTVTQPGAGGAIQVGRIDVQSAGGRNTQVAVQGSHADLQFTTQMRHRYWNWNQPPMAVPPFTWQPDLASALADTYQVNVTMTPWGRRSLHATAMQRGLPEIECSLRFTPSETQPLVGDSEDDNVEIQQGQAVMPFAQPAAGQFEVTVTNTLPFTVREGWLYIAANLALDVQSDQNGAVQTQVIGGGRGGRTVQITAPQQFLQSYAQVRSLPRMSPEAVHTVQFDSALTLQQNRWDQIIQLPGGYIAPLHVEQLDATGVWIILSLEESPILEIDADRSDFDADEGLHLFVQQLPRDATPQLANITSETTEKPDTPAEQTSSP